MNVKNIFSSIAITLLLLTSGASADSVYNSAAYQQYKSSVSSTTNATYRNVQRAASSGSSAGYRQAAREYRALSRYHQRYSELFARMANSSGDQGIRVSGQNQARIQQNLAGNMERNAQRYDRMAQNAARHGR